MCDNHTMVNQKPRGRQPDANSKSGKIRELLGTGMSAADIAKKLGCTTSLVYNVKARMSGAKKGRSTGKPGRPRKAGARTDGLAGILEAVRNSERERLRLRNALERVQAAVAEALG